MSLNERKSRLPRRVRVLASVDRRIDANSVCQGSIIGHLFVTHDQCRLYFRSIMTVSTSTPEELREHGNQAFKQGRFQEAIDRYTEALTVLTAVPLAEPIKIDLTKCYSNRAQCYINLNQFDEAIEDTTRGEPDVLSSTPVLTFSSCSTRVHSR